MNEQKGKHPQVTLTLADGGRIVFRLHPDQAPVTCQNFLKLVDQAFYDGLIFHRVIDGFMIQGGCPLGTGTGGPGYGISGEFSANGVPNQLSHKRGTVSMARSADPNSAGSQFFIVHQDAPHLDGSYAAFGTVLAGMDVVDRIAAASTDGRDRPLTPPTIQSMTWSWQDDLA